MTDGAASRLDFRAFGCIAEALDATLSYPFMMVGDHHMAPRITTPSTQTTAVALRIAAAAITIPGAAGATRHRQPRQTQILHRHRRLLPNHVAFRLSRASILLKPAISRQLIGSPTERLIRVYLNLKRS